MGRLKYILVLAVILSLVPMAIGSLSVFALTSVYYPTVNDGTTFTFALGDYDLVNLPHPMGTGDNLSVEYTTTQLRVGQDNNTNTYWCWRPVLIFDTRGLDGRADISAATIDFWVTEDETDTDFNLNVVEAGDVHAPLIPYDYDTLFYKTQNLINAYDTAADLATDAYNTVTLTALGRTKVQPDGYTVFAFRSDLDIAGTAPAGQEWFSFASGESAHPPRLTLTYTITDLTDPDTLEVTGVNVFSNFREAGDQLYVFRASVVYKDQPLPEMPQEYYAAQLIDLDGLTIRGQVPLRRWGYSPLSIYLSDNQALTWGEAYYIRLLATDMIVPAPAPYDYTLQVADWKGSDMNKLETWVKQAANWLYIQEDVPKTDYLTSVADQWMLTEMGGNIFVEGVPYLDQRISKIFYSRHIVNPEPDAPTGAIGTGWYAAWGLYWTGAFDDFAGVVGLDGQWFLGAILGLLIFMGYAAVNHATQEGTTATVVAVWGVGMATLLGMPPILLFLMVPTVAFLFYYNVFLRGS